MFQSLFLWMTVVDDPLLHLDEEEVGVSILVLVDDGRRHAWYRRSSCRDYRFQSLFLWMTVVDFWWMLTRCFYPARFQSLFLWMTVVDGEPGARFGLVSSVSILVLVDDGRRPPMRLNYTRAWSFESISQGPIGQWAANCARFGRPGELCSQLWFVGISLLIRHLRLVAHWTHIFR